MPRSAASDLCLHCLPRSQIWDAMLKRVNETKGEKSLHHYIKNSTITHVEEPSVFILIIALSVNVPMLQNF